MPRPSDIITKAAFLHLRRVLDELGVDVTAAEEMTGGEQVAVKVNLGDWRPTCRQEIAERAHEKLLPAIEELAEMIAAVSGSVVLARPAAFDGSVNVEYANVLRCVWIYDIEKDDSHYLFDVMVKPGDTHGEVASK